jgi:sugar fermentation stimulation protein A
LNFENLKKEVKYGKNSRIDILAENSIDKNTFIEIKSVTLSRKKNLAEFPDAITSRGSKHLIELSNKCIEGFNSYLVYLIQRKDIKNFSIAKDIDPEYYKNSLIAKNNGVKFIAFICDVNFDGIEIIEEIKIIEH